MSVNTTKDVGQSSRHPKPVQVSQGSSASSRAVVVQPSEHTQRAAPFAIEIFAGSAGLSSALVQVGIAAIPIDHKDNRFTPKVPPKLLDLSKTSGQTELWKLLSLPNLCFVHLSPPCGTASRAREKPLPAELKARGWPEPQPLRSEKHPLGLPNLASISPGNVARVAAANKLFVLSAEICTYLCHRSIPWTLENPRNSLFWWVPQVESLLSHDRVEDVFFQHCMFGSGRDKWTRLRSFPADAFSSLAVTCDGSHTHKQWGAASRISRSVICFLNFATTHSKKKLVFIQNLGFVYTKPFLE